MQTRNPTRPRNLPPLPSPLVWNAQFPRRYQNLQCTFSLFAEFLHRLPARMHSGLATNGSAVGRVESPPQMAMAVARAIASDPALVLADEPTANLDSTTSDELIATMKKLNQDLGVTFVFATHDPKVMDAAQRVVRLVDGEIAEDIRK